MGSLSALLVVSLALVTLAREESTPSPDVTPKEEPEQDLRITYGGFIQNGPENQLLDDVCGTDVRRNVVNCDVHNGLLNWTVTEVTFQVIVTGDDEPHY
jgi:hypothetical protein